MIGDLLKGSDHFLLRDGSNLGLSETKIDFDKVVLLNVVLIFLKNSLEAGDDLVPFSNLSHGADADTKLVHHLESRRGFILNHVDLDVIDAEGALFLLIDNHLAEQSVALPKDVVGRSALVVNDHGLHE